MNEAADSGDIPSDDIFRGGEGYLRRDVPPVIIACPDGPLLIRGSVDMRTVDGAVIPQSRQTIALCRCGVSSIKPFCDGTHKLINFRT